jgi:PAS domain S-box-containing protein
MQSSLLDDEGEAGTVARPMREKSVAFKSARVAFRLRRTRIARLSADIFLPRVRDHARGQRRQALDLSEVSFQALVEKLADIIVVLNGDGTMRYQNSVAEQVLGYKPEDALGVSGFDFVHPEDIEKVQTLFVQLLRRPRRIQTMVLRVRHQANIWRVLEASAVNLLDDQHVEGVVIVCRDVTERQQTYNELQQAYVNVKRKERAQAGKLMRTLLALQTEVRARQQAEIAFHDLEGEVQRLSRFKHAWDAQRQQIRGVAHELRNATASVRLQGETVGAYPDRVSWRERALALQEETQRILLLVDELLAAFRSGG